MTNNTQISENEQLIEEHKKMLLMSGNLSDFQLNNMKIWPSLLFDNIENVGISWDFNSAENEILGAGSVTYDFKFKKGGLSGVGKEVKEKKREQLTLFTKFLFWKDTEVNIKRNGKIWI